MEQTSAKAFKVTKHGLGAVIYPPESLNDEHWVMLGKPQVIAVMRPNSDAPAPTKLSRAEYNQLLREWLQEDPDRVAANFEPPTPSQRPAPTGSDVLNKYLDETVYATWQLT